MAFLRPMLWQICGELSLILINYRIYWFDYLAGMVVDVSFFVTLILGIQAVAQTPNLDVSGPLLMYAAYGIVSSLLQLVAKDTYLEASRGTLEHLALARGGLVQQALLRAVANILFLTVHLSLLMCILALVFRISLQPTVWVPLPFLALLLASLGFSFLMGTLALHFRRVSSTFIIVQFLFAPYFFVLLEWKPFMAYLPFAPGAYLLRQGLSGGNFDPTLFLLALLQGVVLASVGLWAFARMYVLARRRGIFGRY